MLKQKLMIAPVLVYPNFEWSFVLETKGLARNNQLHPVAFPSRTLSPAEKNYSSPVASCIVLMVHVVKVVNIHIDAVPQS